MTTRTFVPQPYSSALELVRRNEELDDELLTLAAAVPEEHLHDEFSDEGWTLAQHLGHLGEFPAFYARQLQEWLDGRRVVLGRVDEYDADYLDALERATCGAWLLFRLTSMPRSTHSRCSCPA